MKFIRYISHELRTPLNIIHIGISVLKKKLVSTKRIVDDRNEGEWPDVRRGSVTNSNAELETLDEISDSCQLALSTLNKLLFYDQLEGKALKLDLRETVIKDFIVQSMRPFRRLVSLLLFIEPRILNDICKHVRISSHEYLLYHIYKSNCIWSVNTRSYMI